MPKSLKKNAKAPAAKLTKTKYPGIYELTHADGDMSFYAMFRRDGKQVKDKIGKRSEGWSTEAASVERALRKKGTRETTVERKQRVRTEQAAGANRMTFRKLLDEYLASKPHLRSAKAARYNFEKHSAPVVGDKLPEEVTHWDIEGIRHKLTKAKARPMTVFHALELIKRLANFGFKRGLCANISFHVELPVVHNKTTEFLNPEEFRRLLAALDTEADPIRNFFSFIIQTGLRRDELQTLQWTDLDLHRKRLIIRPENAKSGREESIPLSEAALDVLHHQWEIKGQRKPHVAKEDLVFFTVTGHVWGKSESAVTKIYKRLHEKADLPESFRMAHGLRHQFGGMHANAGTPPLVLQKLMQHKELSTTQRYIELQEPTLRTAADLTPALIERHRQGNVVDLAAARDRKGA